MTDPSIQHYQAFLSHHSADKPIVEELARRLEQAGISTFLDKWHLIPGTPWQPALETALEQSATCVVFVGPSGLGPWQNEEMRAAIVRRVGDRTKSFRVVPVLLPGGRRQQQSKLPPFLVAATWVEFSHGTVDDENAFHRLKCGILGIPPMPGPESAIFEGECPYRGLQVFDVDDARFFFGRDTQVDWMLDRLGRDFGSLKENRFLAVVGASGSGKSSLVRAGLIPALRSGHSRSGKGIAHSPEWPVVILKPGAEPLKALADALWLDPVAKAAVPDPLTLADQLRQDERRLHATIGTALAGHPEHRRLVIVVDQFEELFTQFEARLNECRDDPQRRHRVESERTAFVDNLLYAAAISGGRSLVILTLRADFYGKFSSFARLAAALGDAQELVPPLEDNDLRAAIERPAQACGLEFEPGLVDLLMQDMQRQPPGALPLLQQSLYMLYERRSGRRLTVKAYREMGKIEGALEDYADRFYLETLTTPQQREICKRVLMMLVTPGEGAEDTRRRVCRSQLGESVEADAVLQELVKARLITISDANSPQVEVTHEALIRGWKRLRQWLNADRASLRTLQELLDAAEDWDKHQRDPAYLLTGSRLLQAEEWRGSHPDDLLDLTVATEFLDTAVKSRDAAKRRRRTIAVTLAAIGSCLLIAAGISSVFLWWEKDRATRNERETRRLAAESLIQNGITAIQYENDDFGAIYNFTKAMKAAGTDASVTRRAARNLISGSSRSLPIRSFVQCDPFGDAFSPDGKCVLIQNNNKKNSVRLWESMTGEPLGRPMEHNSYVEAMAYSSDGKRIVTSQDNAVRIWDAITAAPLGSPMKHDDKVIDVTFSPDGTRILTASNDNTARLWNIMTGEQLGQAMKHKDDVDFVIFSPDGTRVLTGSDDDTARLWDGRTGAQLGEPMKHEDDVRSGSFSPDGTRVLTGSNDSTARLWNGLTGVQIGQPMEHDGSVIVAKFSPDGTRILTGAADRRARLWHGTTGAPLSKWMLHRGRVNDVAFSPDGKRVLTGCEDFYAYIWDGMTGDSLGRAMSHEGFVNHVEFSSDGTRILTGCSDNTSRIWDAMNGLPLGRTLTREGLYYEDVRAVAFSPDGTRVLIGDRDSAFLWDGVTGEPLGMPMKHNHENNWITSVAFSSDGRRVLTGSGDGARLWDGITGAPIGQQMTHASGAIAVFSTDGLRVLTGSYDRTARLWDGMTGAALCQPLKHQDWVYAVAFSPDGTRMLSGTSATVRLWDAVLCLPLGRPMVHDDEINSVAFSPDGTRVLTGCDDDTAKLWDGMTGAPRGQPMKHEDDVVSVAFSPDGTRVLTGSRDYTARLWDGMTGAQLGHAMIHRDAVNVVAFTPDGTRVLTGSDDSTARLWDGMTGAPLGQPLIHEDHVTAVAFSPDGTRALTGGDNYNNARLWEVPPPALDDPERIWLSTEVRTGWTIENGSRRALTPEEHHEKKKRLDALGGDCLNRTYNDLTEAEKLELRTPLHIPTSAKMATAASSQP